MLSIIETLGAFIMIISIFAIMAYVIKAILDHRLKSRILDAGPVDDNVMKLVPALPKFNTEMLKWGIILLFAGLGLILLEFIPYNADSSPLPFGIETVFIATGFLVYSFLVKKQQQ